MNGKMPKSFKYGATGCHLHFSNKVPALSGEHSEGDHDGGREAG